MVFPFAASATELSLTYSIGGTHFNEQYNNPELVTNVQRTVAGAEAHKSEPATESSLTIEDNKKKSRWPSILGCGLLGLSMIGDSEQWRGGSAVLCGGSLVYYFN